MAGAPTELCCNEKREISPLFASCSYDTFLYFVAGPKEGPKIQEGQVAIQGLLKETVLLLFLLKSGRAIALI